MKNAFEKHAQECVISARFASIQTAFSTYFQAISNATSKSVVIADRFPGNCSDFDVGRRSTHSCPGRPAKARSSMIGNAWRQELTTSVYLHFSDSTLNNLGFDVRFSRKNGLEASPTRPHEFLRTAAFCARFFTVFFAIGLYFCLGWSLSLVFAESAFVRTFGIILAQLPYHAADTYCFGR